MKTFIINYSFNFFIAIYPFCILIYLLRKKSLHSCPYTITQNSDTITETVDFCVIVQFHPNRPFISGIKTQKREARQPRQA